LHLSHVVLNAFRDFRKATARCCSFQDNTNLYYGNAAEYKARDSHYEVGRVGGTSICSIVL